MRRHDTGPLAGTLEHYFPDADENGMYELADPAIGPERHHKKNAIFTSSISVAIHLVCAHGFSIRMRGDKTGQRNLISRNDIQGLPHA